MKNRTLEDLRTQGKDTMNNNCREVKEFLNNNLSTQTSKATMVEMKDLSEKKLKLMMKGYKENGYIIIAPFYGKPNAGYYLIANHWLKTMKNNIDDLLEQIGKSGFMFTPVIGLWNYGGTGATGTFFETIYIVYNVHTNDTVSSEAGLNRLKEFGKNWCKQFNLNSFLFVPERDKEKDDKISLHTAYLLNADAEAIDHFNSVSIANDVEKYSKLRSKKLNIEHQEEPFLAYSEGSLLIPEDHVNLNK
ncbi:hypothetical protein JEZ13_12030 [bacterium]|nr:hypothetical protein [bacterium]